jgi:hypothetical protein
MSYEFHKYYNGNLYVNIAKDVKHQQLFMDLHVGIAYGCKKIVTITIPICEYCIFEMALWKL